MATLVSTRGAALGLRRLVAGRQRNIIPACCPLPNSYQRSWFASFPPHEVVGLPSLSPTMESGSIASWNLSEGDAFAAGDVFCSVETDKATVDFEAQDDGVVAKILVPAGPDEIKCGQPILVTVDEVEDVAAFVSFTLADAGGAAAPPAASKPKEETSSPPPPPPATPPPAAAASPPTPARAAAPSTEGRVVASPLAYMLAKEMGHDISAIPGTGPGGRIIAADVKEYVPGEQPVAAVASAGQPAAFEASREAMLAGPPVQGDGFMDFPISEAAKEIAARMVQSKRNVPHYYLTVDITMDNLLKTRASLNASAGEKATLGVYEFLLKAAASSMKVVPTANASWMDSVVRVYDSVDINVVTGSGDSMFTPLLRDCGKKGIQTISNELAQSLSYLEGERGAEAPAAGTGTFTVINIGMYGVKSCAPIIREPQACALALGTLENRIVPNDDADSDEMYKQSVVMTATLSCDHRVVDGAVGAQWLSAFKTYVENPYTLLL